MTADGAPAPPSLRAPLEPLSRGAIAKRLLLISPFLGWVLWRLSEGEIRWEYSIFLVLPPLLAFLGPRSRRLLDGLYPLALLALLYDAMRFVKNVGVSPARLHICDLRALDARWFGFADGTTIHDWLKPHATPLLDRLCAIPYGTFLEVTVVFSVFLYGKDYVAMKRFGWTFFVVNLVGFTTYHLYPAAPPWYFHAHGCTVDLAAHASEGPNLARVDQWLGFPYFHGFYGRSSDVFGAVPSLHVAYPTLILVNGWRHLRAPGRTLAILFFVSMCFAAIYLDHHWVIDVLMGVGYTLVVHRLVGAVMIALARRQSSTRDGSSQGGREGERPAPSKLEQPPDIASADRTIAFRLATWFGCGLVPGAPGTVGTFGALPLYFLVRPLGHLAVLAMAVVVTGVGVWASSEVARTTRRKDPQIVVIDEVAGVLFTLAAVPDAPGHGIAILVGVLFFRLFDQLKPFPAHLAESGLPSGWGIMFDDVFAGAWGAAAITFLAAVGAV